MENRSFYNEILTEHNIHPEFKHDLPDANIELEEAGALKDISHMPARVKCAVLGWRTLKEAIGGEEE